MLEYGWKVTAFQILQIDENNEFLKILRVRQMIDVPREHYDGLHWVDSEKG